MSGSVLVAGQGDHPGHRPVLIPDPGRSQDVLVHARVRTPRRRAGAGSVEEVVAGVAGGRAKRGRLVQALQVRPAALTDGRSPAPQVVGNAVHHTPASPVTTKLPSHWRSRSKSKSPGTAPRAIPLHHGLMQTTHDSASQMSCLPL